MDVKWNLFVKQFVTYGGYKVVLDGLEATLLIAVFGLLIGMLIGTLIAITKVIPQYKFLPKLLSKTSDIYLGFFRGTPIVVQLLLAYFILFPAMDLHISKLVVAIIAFGLNSGAYQAEIMRAGILSVDKGQMEAGRALGMSYASTMTRVVIPQAVKNILPTLGNELIILIKDTSVVSFIAVVDLTSAFRQLASANYEYVVPYLVLAAFYLVLIILVTIGIHFLEKRMHRNERNTNRLNVRKPWWQTLWAKLTNKNGGAK